MIGLYLFWSTSVGSYQAFEFNSWCFDFIGRLCCNCVRCTVEFVGFNRRAVFFSFSFFLSFFFFFVPFFVLAFVVKVCWPCFAI